MYITIIYVFNFVGFWIVVGSGCRWHVNELMIKFNASLHFASGII